ncbi:hypothetical protein [Kribbella sp. NPDC051620]|uniref:hypothetical protein n=1 Tax=Kribbella sp. NPDC051620 TaxID=3364120 RepID=UPI00378F2C78
MIAKAFRLVHVCGCLVAVLLSFLVVSNRNDIAPLPAGAAVKVIAWSGSGGVKDFRIALDQFGREHRISFGHEVPDLEKRGRVRHLYLVDGAARISAATWRSGRLGDFGGSMSTVIHPLADEGDRSPLGNYQVLGDSDDALALQAFLTSCGMTVELSDFGRLGAIPRPITLTLGVLILLTVAMAGAFVAAGTRRYAIGRLHGLPYLSLLSAEFRRFAVQWAIAGPASLLLAAGFLLLRYGPEGIGLFVAVCVAVQVLLLFAAMAAQAVFLAMVTSIDLPAALKGELPSLALTITSYGLRLTAVVVGLGTIVTTVSLGADIAARDRAGAAFERLGNLSAVTLGNAYSGADERQLDALVGPWLRDADRRGQLLVAAQQVYTGADPRWRGTTTLIVNDKFLADQPVRLANGGTLRTADRDSITVLVPESHWAERARLREQLGLEARLRQGVSSDFTEVRSASAQRVFTYAPARTDPGSVQVWDSAKTFVTDPVIVVMPAGRGWLSNTSYAAFASQGGALLADPRSASVAVDRNPLLARFVLGITPVADKAAAELAEQTSQLRLSAFIALIACLVVFISGAAAAIIRTRQKAQRIFVRDLHGWSFPSIHRGLLALELCLLIALVAWIPYRIAGQRRELERWQTSGSPLPVELPSINAGQLTAIAVLALVTAGGFLLTLSYAHRRVVRGGLSEA